MKIVFVDNFFYLRSTDRVMVTVSPQLGLLSLAAILEEAGHNVAILDPKLVFSKGQWRVPEPAFYQAWADAVLDLVPDIVGFTALGRTLPHTVAAAAAIKERQWDLPILIGGPHATILGRDLLEPFPCIDVLVRYEAEPQVRDVVEAVYARRDLSSIPNLVFRTPLGIVSTAVEQRLPDMDQLPFPAYHLYPEEELIGKELAVEAGRGCPFACTFCSTANFFQRRYRLKSTDRLIDDMERLRAQIGTSVIDLNHDLFGLNKKMLQEFCSKVRGRGLKWKCSMRPDTIDVTLVEELASAGCISIYFGVESGSARMQNIIAKRLDLAEATRAIRAALDIGLVCTASFVTGFPEETVEDLDATLDLIGRFAALSPDRLMLQLHILSPEPGSDLANREYAMRFDGIGPEMDEFADSALISRYPALFSAFYHFDTLLPRSWILRCTAFVTFVMPELGHCLISLILSTHFDGRLSLLLKRIMQYDESEICISFASIVDALWNGLDRTIAEHSNDGSYFRELVRFSRILSECRHQCNWANEVEFRDSGGDTVVVAPFAFPVAEIARELLLRGTVERILPLTPTDSWYAFHRSSQDQIEILPLGQSEISAISEIYKFNDERLACTSQSLFNLGAITLA
jgi:radical SAM superfamily enzyme YgiQ (UPF0313 family)